MIRDEVEDDDDRQSTLIPGSRKGLLSFLDQYSRMSCLRMQVFRPRVCREKIEIESDLCRKDQLKLLSSDSLLDRIANEYKSLDTDIS